MKIVVIVTGLLVCISTSARSQEPICVIDGVRVAPAICSRSGGLDPVRIESIEIVKGQAAAAEYGPAGASGVIRITTKGGAGMSAQTSDDPLGRFFFPPELVMAHQQAINLTDRQRTAIQGAMTETQAKFVDLQFALSRETERLQRLLAGDTVNESAVLEQVDRVLAAEREIKRAQLSLMIRIRNQLTEQQQTALRLLRR